jgi:hypothetical protein
VRGSIVVQNGQLLWPPPPPPTPAPGAPSGATLKPTTEKPVPVETNYFANTLKDAVMYTGGNTPHYPHIFLTSNFLHVSHICSIVRLGHPYNNQHAAQCRTQSHDTAVPAPADAGLGMDNKG